MLPGDACPLMVIVAIETTHDIELQNPIAHRAAEVVKGVSHTLHLPVVLANGEAPLLKGVEGRVGSRAWAVLPRSWLSRASKVR